MKKAAVIAGLFLALFLGSMVTAQAGTQFTFGFSIGIGPAVPYGYYYYPAYPPYYYSNYYAYPYYPSYGTYVAPRYYGAGRSRPYNRYYGDSGRSRWNRHDGRSNSRSRSNRW
jgi:hypothetical protein